MGTSEERRRLRRELGSQLKMLRERTRMTQEDLANLMNIHSVTLRYWEIGKSLPLAPNLQILIRELVRRGALKKETEVRELWDKAREAGLTTALDEEWLTKLRGKYLLPVPKPHNPKPEPANMAVQTTTSTDAKIGVPLSSQDERFLLGNHSSTQAHEIYSYQDDLFLKVQNRQRMIDQIDNIWIKGLLEQSLKNGVEIELELCEQLDAVEPSQRQYLYLQEEQQPREERASGRHILDAYQNAHHKLLILGEPGSGKTTLLLQLTRILLDVARDDIMQPIPMIFSLASWVKKRLTIEQWIVEELSITYHIRPTLGQQWVEQDQILPLFDGLDEIDMVNYTLCIDALNVYLQEHGLVPTVICSRRNEYLNQPEHLFLQKAFLVQPLTEKKIDDYMQRMQVKNKEFYNIFMYEVDLRTPFMLHVIFNAYEDRVNGTIHPINILDFQKQAFATYILKMFERRAHHVHYNLPQTIKYLRWLARQLDQHNQKQFYIEFMQYSWLPKYPFRQLYLTIAVALVYGLLSSFGYSISYLPYYSFSQVSIFFLFIAAFNTLLYGFFNGILSGFLVDDQEKAIQTSLKRGRDAKLRQKVTAILGNRVIYGILNGLLDGIFVGLTVNSVSGWICGLFSCLFCTALGQLDAEIKCAEYLKWSGASMVRNAGKFLAGGLLVGLFYGLVTGRNYLFTWAQLFPALLLGLGIGLLVGLVMSIRGGFILKAPDTKNILKPNQGIRNSMRNSLFFGSFFGVAFGLLFGLIYGPVLFLILGETYRSSFPANSGLVYGVSDGLIVAAFFWLVSGGIACIQHGLLRLILWMGGSIPWSYASFLDDAVDLALLHKLGGGYIFFHRLLQEYFSTLEDSQIEKDFRDY